MLTLSEVAREDRGRIWHRRGNILIKTESHVDTERTKLAAEFFGNHEKTLKFLSKNSAPHRILCSNSVFGLSGSFNVWVALER